MNATTVAVDLAKNLFQLAYADASWKLMGTARLTRSQFRRCLQNTSVSLVITTTAPSAGTSHTNSDWSVFWTGVAAEERRATKVAQTLAAGSTTKATMRRIRMPSRITVELSGSRTQCGCPLQRRVRRAAHFT
jgi:hypothetical protein